MRAGAKENERVRKRLLLIKLKNVVFFKDCLSHGIKMT